MDEALLFSESLALPGHAVPYALHARIQRAFPGKAILATSECAFDVEAFAHAGRAEATA